jgi:hypothetical protein
LPENVQIYGTGIFFLRPVVEKAVKELLKEPVADSATDSAERKVAPASGRILMKDDEKINHRDVFLMSTLESFLNDLNSTFATNLVKNKVEKPEMVL